MDDLEQRIRAARPVSGHRDLPLSDRAKRELAELMLANAEHHVRPRAARPQRRVRRVGIAALLSVVAVMSAVTIVDVVATPPASATTPAPLVVLPLDRTAQDVLVDLQRRAADTAAAGTPTRVVVEVWTLDEGAGTADGPATPGTLTTESHDIVVTPGGVVSVTVIPGQTVQADGSLGPAQAAQGGGVASRPDDLDRIAFPGPLPDSRAQIAAFFRDAVGATAPIGAAQAIRATEDLLFQQALSPRQQQALLGAFADLPDLTLAGTTLDRAGRAAIVFTAVDPAQRDEERWLLVSPVTGRILATETLYTGDDRADLSAPAVVGFSLWK